MTSTAAGHEVKGHTDRAFEPVADAFAEIVARGEQGAGVAVTVDGQLVVDLWAGHRDAQRTLPWTKDTITPVASTSKGLTSFLVHVLADRGVLDIDAPVARYWPAFAAAGKDAVTVRELLGHRAGAVGERGAVADGPDHDERYAAALAAAEPFWEPGSAQGYHAKTFHVLTGELVRQATGEALPVVFAREITAPLELQAVLDTPTPEELETIAWSSPHPSPAPPADDMLELMARMGSADEVVRGAFMANPPERPPVPGEQTVISPGGIATNARSLARAYSVLAGEGHPVLSGAGIEGARAPQGRSTDLVLGADLERTAGYIRSGPEGWFGPNAEAFGHDGAGGSCGFADPAAAVGFGFVTASHQFESLFGDSRKMALVAALYGALNP
jgi:CubicO group peptidase (beta-lactamase class C family)